MGCIPREVGETPYQRDPVALAALRRFADKGLVWKMAHMLLQVLNLVRQKEWVRHKPEVNREETLQPRYNDTENVFLGEVLQNVDNKNELTSIRG